MTPDEERWAEALQVVKMKGDEASTFVAERIAALEAAGAEGGVQRWSEIGARVLLISEAEQQQQ